SIFPALESCAAGEAEVDAGSTARGTRSRPAASHGFGLRRRLRAARSRRAQSARRERPPIPTAHAAEPAARLRSNAPSMPSVPIWAAARLAPRHDTLRGHRPNHKPASRGPRGGCRVPTDRHPGEGGTGRVTWTTLGRPTRFKVAHVADRDPRM